MYVVTKEDNSLAYVIDIYSTKKQIEKTSSETEKAIPVSFISRPDQAVFITCWGCDKTI